MAHWAVARQSALSNVGAAVNRTSWLLSATWAPVQMAKSAKHLAYVVQKRAVRFARNLRTATTSRLWFYQSERAPYVYFAQNYRRSFLNWDAEEPTQVRDVPGRIFCLWTGDNNLTSRRAANLNRIRSAHDNLEVILVTPSNLHEWVVPEHPLHPAYTNLSLVHRSDYLRAYLLHHHGGAYSDIKAPQHAWSDVFDIFRDPNVWLVGYPERSTQWVAQLPRKLGRDLKHYYRCVPGGGSYVARPDTQLTREWIAEVERRLDYFSPLLEQNPGGMRNEVDSYPIGWNDLLAKVTHPLALKFHEHIYLTEVMLPNLENYQ